MRKAIGVTVTRNHLLSAEAWRGSPTHSMYCVLSQAIKEHVGGPVRVLYSHDDNNRQAGIIVYTALGRYVVDNPEALRLARSFDNIDERIARWNECEALLPLDIILKKEGNPCVTSL